MTGPTCSNCGCTKPCPCDYYTPDDARTCGRCGCTKPCACDGYTRLDDQPEEEQP